MITWNAIAAHLTTLLPNAHGTATVQPVGGGCINTTAVLQWQQTRCFIKCHRADLLPMFTAEAAGLTALAATRTVRVPQPLATGCVNEHAFLALEYVELTGQATERGIESAATQLAALHQVTAAHYGWERDNTIGATPQRNTPATDWVAFWCEQRLGFQLQLAARHGYHGQLQERGALLLEQLPMLLNHAPAASLLHGDLWSGNLDYDAQQQPVIFDPAVYYGDRETDVAMTELFGGFPPRFYAAYRAAYPLPVEYALRRDVYNLYHVLNHLNLFGAGYLRQATGLMARILAELC